MMADQMGLESSISKTKTILKELLSMEDAKEMADLSKKMEAIMVLEKTSMLMCFFTIKSFLKRQV